MLIVLFAMELSAGIVIELFELDELDELVVLDKFVVFDTLFVFDELDCVLTVLDNNVMFSI